MEKVIALRTSSFALTGGLVAVATLAGGLAATPAFAAPTMPDGTTPAVSARPSLTPAAFYQTAPAPVPAQPATDPELSCHNVVRGDTYGRIATSVFGSTVPVLRPYNSGIENPDVIIAGKDRICGPTQPDAPASPVMDDSNVAPAADVTPATNLGEQMLAFAERRDADPYVWGGQAPGGFDCSGLILWALKQAGLDLGDTTAQGLYDLAGSRDDMSYVPLSEARRGDLVVFGSSDNSITHIGIVSNPDTGEMFNAATRRNRPQERQITHESYERRDNLLPTVVRFG